MEKSTSSRSFSKKILSKAESGVFGHVLKSKKNSGATISVDDLCVSVDTRGIITKFRDKLQGSIETNKKEILHSLSGIVVRPGQLLAILGTSGSGKSTLLNTLSGRLEDNMQMTGDICFDSEKPTQQFIRKTVGYVMQNDYLLPNVTVRETLRYAALLRLPSDITYKEKISIADRILTNLNLKECADTYIGGNGRRGVSGGEKRRVSIGVQLLTNPGVLLLDEPTTGLDSFTANNIVQLLSELAAENRTIICTIHQPRSDIFKMFDLVLLLSKGNAVYFGPAKEMVSYFSKLNYECPTVMNPADYYMDLITVDNRTPEAEKRTLDILDSLVDAYKKNSQETSKLVPLATNEMPYFEGAGFLLQSAVLLQRNIKNTVRDRMSFLARFIEVILMGIAMGLIFYQLESTLSGLTARFAFLYTMNIMQPYLLMINTLLHYSRELLIYDRERFDGMVKPLPYFLAVKITNLPLDIVSSIIFGSITYWMAGMRSTASNFFWYLLITFLVQYSIVSLSFMTSAFIRTFAVSSMIVNLITAWWSYSSGFLLNPDSFPPYLYGIQYTSPNAWSLGALSANEYKDNKYPCPVPGSAECALYDGNVFLDSLKLKSPHISPNIGIVAGIALFFDLVALIALILVKYKPK